MMVDELRRALEGADGALVVAVEFDDDGSRGTSFTHVKRAEVADCPVLIDRLKGRSFFIVEADCEMGID